MPSYVIATFTDTSFTISWTAPFSLDVTGVDPDIWYSVFIYNVTDENNPTAILCTDCNRITETHYTFTPDYLGPCYVFNSSVIPVNGAGQGESSPNVTSCAQYGGITIVLAIYLRHMSGLFYAKYCPSYTNITIEVYSFSYNSFESYNSLYSVCLKE